MLNLQDRRALVTGGSRGIGRATATLFGRLGARVALSYARDREAAESAARDASGPGGPARALRADLAEPGAAAGLVAAAVEALGGLDILVVNHGIWRRAPLAQLDAAAWRETIDVNLTSAAALCRAAAAAMPPASTIVLVSSTAGQRGEANYGHYAASKGGLLALGKSLSLELAGAGIRVNSVAPGWVVTDMSRAALEGPEGPAALAKIPLGRAGTPEEIAGPIAFLASELVSYLHGEVLCVNGGAVML